MSKSSGPKGRGRNRNNSGRRPQNRGGNFDANSGRNRGNAQQLMDKYLTLARDAASQGDRIAAENFFQHADHYYRVVYARNEQQEARRLPANNGEAENAQDPIPVQSMDDGKGPVGLVGEANTESAVQPRTNGSEATDNDGSVDLSGAQDAVGDVSEVKKPRRGRPSKKDKQSDSDSPAPEAAE